MLRQPDASSGIVFYASRTHKNTVVIMTDGRLFTRLYVTITYGMVSSSVNRYFISGFGTPSYVMVLSVLL